LNVVESGVLAVELRVLGLCLDVVVDSGRFATTASSFMSTVAFWAVKQISKEEGSQSLKPSSTRRFVLLLWECF